MTGNLPSNFRGVLQGAAVVKITGDALFTDVHILTNLLKEFNIFGEALAYITNFDELSNLQQSIDEKLESITDRNQKAALRERLKALSDIKAIAKKSGLYKEPAFLKHLDYLISYMMKDAFDVRISLMDTKEQKVLFNAPLDRKSLREPCEAIIRKYSRRCEQPLTLVGIITQGNGQRKIETEEDDQTTTDPKQNLRKGLFKMAHAISGLEEVFFGRLDNEYVIDPIAVFRQL